VKFGGFNILFECILFLVLNVACAANACIFPMKHVFWIAVMEHASTMKQLAKNAQSMKNDRIFVE